MSVDFVSVLSVEGENVSSDDLRKLEYELDLIGAELGDDDGWLKPVAAALIVVCSVTVC